MRSSTNTFTSLSIRKPEKTHCGDASFAGIVRINDEDGVLLIVADGVSRSPKDWLASGSTVDFIVEGLNNSNLPVKLTIRKAIIDANIKIYSGVENTIGMLSTLSVVFYQPSSKKLYLCNVGDSRIYGFKNERWEQLTSDDSNTQPYKENGKLKLLNGMPVMLSSLTKAIGHSFNLEIEIKEISEITFEALILASDGFYNLDGFEQYASTLANAADMKRAALQIQTTIVAEIKDDASFAIIRLSHQSQIDLRKIVKQNDTAQIVSTSAILSVFEGELKQAIIGNEIEYLEGLLQLMERRSLFYCKEKMIELLELMIKNKSILIPKMTGIIRKL